MFTEYIPKYIISFPIKKKEISEAILSNKSNLKKIIDVVHKEVRKKMRLFLNADSIILLYSF